MPFCCAVSKPHTSDVTHLPFTLRRTCGLDIARRHSVRICQPHPGVACNTQVKVPSGEVYRSRPCVSASQRWCVVLSFTDNGHRCLLPSPPPPGPQMIYQCSDCFYSNLKQFAATLYQYTCKYCLHGSMYACLGTMYGSIGTMCAAMYDVCCHVRQDLPNTAKFFIPRSSYSKVIYVSVWLKIRFCDVI